MWWWCWVKVLRIASRDASKRDAASRFHLISRCIGCPGATSLQHHHPSDALEERNIFCIYLASLPIGTPPTISFGYKSHLAIAA